MTNNIIMLQDSYKLSHFNQYPKNTTIIHSYLESRGGEYDKLVFVGLQYYLKEFLVKRVTHANIDEAEEFAQLHGLPFNREGWVYIVDFLDGFLPIAIKAVPEGTVVAPKNVMLTFENTDPQCAWLTSSLETLILKLWYPITVASKSLHVKEIISIYHDLTMNDTNGVAFSYHNFGDRGSSSVESAAIGGFAHLTQFMGTDNFNSLKLCKDFYKEKIAGFSIRASEHSTVTSHGRENEYKMIEQYLEDSKGTGMIACVLDSYNIFNAVDFVTSKLKSKIESADYPIFVIRPDSGEPLEIIDSILKTMEQNAVAYTVNSKGYKLFNKFRIIWGDGITPEVIDKILNMTTNLGYAAGNFAFGSGGDLMQNLNRDTAKFAVKCSAAVVDGVERQVFKDPITDHGKLSKKGRQTLVRWKKAWDDKKVSDIQTIALKDFNPELHEELLVEVFRDGKILHETTMEQIRSKTKI